MSAGREQITFTSKLCKNKIIFKKASLTVPLDLNYCDDNSLGLNETDLKFS